MTLLLNFLPADPKKARSFVEIIMPLWSTMTLSFVAAMLVDLLVAQLSVTPQAV